MMVAYKLNPASHDDLVRRRRAGAFFCFSVVPASSLPDQRHLSWNRTITGILASKLDLNHIEDVHFRHYLLAAKKALPLLES